MIFHKVLLLIFFFTLVLCDDIRSQSTFFLDEEVEEASLLSEYPFLHGFGVHYYSDFEPDSSYKRACEKALDDLSTNLFISVYVEEFRSASYSEYSFPELSVKDSTLTFNEDIAKIDSFQVAGNAYCIAGLKEVQEQNTVLGSIPSMKELRIRPVKVNDTWFALGMEKTPKYNPYISWLKAKNNALIDLSRVLKTMIQSSEITIDDRSAELTYFKSNLIFEDIIVARRYVSNDHLIVMIAIPEHKVYEY